MRHAEPLRPRHAVPIRPSSRATGSTVTVPALLLGAALLAGCGSTAPTTTTDAGATDLAMAADLATSDAGHAALGHCDYTNQFSQTAECKDYIGASWTMAMMATDCGKQKASKWSAGGCDRTTILGSCLLDTGTDTETQVVFPGSDASACKTDKLGCETFGGGTFVPAAACVGM